MPTQNVNLTPRLERFVREAVESGEFNNASEVHRAALAAMAREREERALRLERLRREIDIGMNSGRPRKIQDVGRFLEECLEEVIREESRAAKHAPDQC